MCKIQKTKMQQEESDNSITDVEAENQDEDEIGP